MDNEFYEVSINPYRSYNSRYKNSSLLTDSDTGEVVLSTREPISIPSNPNDIYHRIQSNEVNRLDLLAAKYYKNPLFWWIIAQANNIYNPFIQLESGRVLRIPDIETLYGRNGILL